MKNKIIFSGMQPSGILTIGNYIGAIHQWINLQKKCKCIYSIVDLHAITKFKNIYLLNKTILDILALYLAYGLDYKNNIIFLQSNIPEHSQLNWILNCYVYFGELKRMPQFKKKIKNNSNINLGVFNYPILMASDALLYNADYIPAGEDQKQHIELIRIIASRFNKKHGKTFSLPQYFSSNIGAKIMSLITPNKKMSKSDKNKNNIITLLDDKDTIKNKIKLATTDSKKPPKIKYDPLNSPGISNLLKILSIIKNQPIKSLENEFYGKMYIHLKNELSEYLSNFIEKSRKKFFLIRKDEQYLKNILKNGAKKARIIANKTLKKVNRTLNILN